MLRNSGDIWGIIIGVLFALIIIFLITREFWCWYWKINRILALMEDQNNLLRKQLNLNSINEKNDTEVNNYELQPGEFIVNKKTSIFAGPGETYRHICVVENGEVLLEKRNEGEWTLVTMKNGKEGWCKKT